MRNIYLVLLMISLSAFSQQRDCINCNLQRSFGISDSLINVTLSDGTILSGIRGVERTYIGNYSNQSQAIKISWLDTLGCQDSTIQITDIDKFWIYGVGKNPTIAFKILPVKEYLRTTQTKFPKQFLEFNILGGYAGQDESEDERQVGFDNLFYGIEANFFAARNFLLEDASLLISASAITERSRWRIPVGLQYRWTFTGAPKIVDTIRYVPDPCRFQSNPNITSSAPLPGEGFIERKFSGNKDSTSYLMQDKAMIYSRFRPYLMVEGGTVFDTDFEGSGSTPAINSDDYMQYYIGGGIGLNYKRLNFSLSYRLMRLNLRTPCENCTDNFIVNTNISNSLVLKFGYVIYY